MSTWYWINAYDQEICAVEVIRETKTQVVIVETYLGKTSEYRRFKCDEYFPSFEDAKASLIQRLESEISRHSSGLARANKQLLNARTLEKP